MLSRKIYFAPTELSLFVSKLTWLYNQVNQCFALTELLQIKLRSSDIFINPIESYMNEELPPKLCSGDVFVTWINSVNEPKPKLQSGEIYNTER